MEIDNDEEAVLAQWAEITADNGSDVDAEPAANTDDGESRTRDESGKFVAKAKESKEADSHAEPVETDQASANSEKPAEVDQAAQEAPQRDMPATWKHELAPHWSTLPQPVQEEILRREENQRTGIGKYKQQAEAYQRFSDATRPYEATLRQFGVTAEVAAAELFRADHVLRYGAPQQKAAMVRQMLADYGIDAAGIMPSGEQEQQAQVDPQIAALHQEIAQLRQGQQNEQQQRQTAQNNQIISTLIEFAYERDPTTGQPKIRGTDEYGNTIFQPRAGAEHFETLRPYMAALMEADPTIELKDAYDRAAYAHPSTRQAILAEQQSQQRVEAERKAKLAKESGVVNIRSRGSFEPKQAQGSMDDTMREDAIRLGIIS